jgi:nucleotide-binding universal stress UspA family protein
MFETIVVGLDGSDRARSAIPFAAELARRDNAKIVIAHVEQQIVGKGGEAPPAGEEDMRAQLHKEAEALSGEGIDASVKVSSIMLGGPAHAIARIAGEAGADLIVVGTRGESPLTGLLLGSVTHRLLHIAEQPVPVVPPTARPTTS